MGNVNAANLRSESKGGDCHRGRSVGGLITGIGKKFCRRFESNSNVAQDVLHALSRASRRRRGRHEFALLAWSCRHGCGRLHFRGRERLILGRRTRRLQLHRQTTSARQTRPVVGRDIAGGGGGRGRVLGWGGGGGEVFVLMTTAAAQRHDDQEQSRHSDGDVRNY